MAAILLAVVASCSLSGQTYSITTFAGGGLPGNTPGNSASLVGVYGVAIDRAGNAFIALTAYQTVLRLDATTGILTRVAGNGTPGFSGDNGPAISAQLNGLTGIAVDSAGNLYIAEHARIREVTVANGVITTVAGNGSPGFSGDGGPATSAEIGSPNFNSSVALDSTGNLYIPDYTSNRVRKVSNGVITTVAGTGSPGSGGDNGPATSAQLNGPTGVAVDSAGNLYIADTLNHRIRKVTNGVITTMAGNGTQGSNGDNGSATSAQLNSPENVCVDSAGNLYVTGLDDRVRRVANGVITTFAGTGTIGFSGDNGPAAGAQLDAPEAVGVDTAGNVYIADSQNERIRKVANGIITTIAGGGSSVGDNGPPSGAQLYAPYGLAVDAANDLYIADGRNNRIRRVSNGVITTTAGSGTADAGGYAGDNGAATSAQLDIPTGVAVDTSGNVYILDSVNARLRRVSNGVITTVAGDGNPGFSGDNGPAATAQLGANANGVAVDLSGNVYIADTGNNRIRKVANGLITTVAGNGAPGYSGDNGPATNAALNSPYGVAVDAGGSLYIADGGNSCIRKVTNGVITTIAGTGKPGYSGDNGPATSAQLSSPAGLAVDSAGSLYIADQGNPSFVRKVAGGIITTIAGNGTFGFSGDGGPATNASFSLATGIAIDSTGNIYVSDNLNDRVRLLTPSTTSCIYSVTPGSLQASALGGTFSFTIQTGASCSWIISGLPSWITISGASSGSGPATVTMVIAADTGAARSVGISVAGVTIGVAQQGAPQPAAPTIGAVTNAASNLSGPISPGEIVVLYGSGIGPAQLTYAQVGGDGLYDAQLAGMTVQFNGIPAPILYTSTVQVAAIVPYELTGASVQVTATYQGQTSAPVTVVLAPSAPGLFTLGATGSGEAAAINQNQATNGAAAPVPIGSIITLFATGEGQTSPAGVDGKPASASPPTPTLPVNVTIGGVTVNNLQYVGGAPGEVAGVLQINVQVPAGVAPGSAVPIVIRVGDATSQPGVTIAVSAQ